MNTVLLAPIFQQLLTRIQQRAIPIKGPINFTTEHVAAARHEAGPDRGIPVTDMVISQRLWSELSADAAWSDFLDPVTKVETLKTGHFASLFGMNLWALAFTDHPQVEKLRSLPELIFRDAEGTFYFYAVHREVKPDVPTLHTATASALLQELISRVDQEAPAQQSYLSHLRLALQIVGGAPGPDLSQKIEFPVKAS